MYREFFDWVFELSKGFHFITEFFGNVFLGYVNQEAFDYNFQQSLLGECERVDVDILLGEILLDYVKDFNVYTLDF